MANINSIYYNSPSKQLFVDNESNQFVVSGYRLVVDPTLNRDLLLVNPPTSTGDFGRKGNIAFDQNHIFYCVDTNKWLRAKLASWTPPGQDLSLYGVDVGSLPLPTNWWSFYQNGLDRFGIYNFMSNSFLGSPSFSEAEGVRNTVGQTSLINYTSNLVQPSVVNESFTLSFEIKKSLPGIGGFVMGNPFGKLGFYVNYVNTASGKTGPNGNRGAYEIAGNNLQFALSAHTPSIYRWASVATTSEISQSTFSQIVCTNDSATKTINIYCNGVLQGTYDYSSIPLGSKYNNPSYQGWGIGASPRGSVGGSSVAATEYYYQVSIKNMGFWRGRALNQSHVTDLYNGGVFKRYPFV